MKLTEFAILFSALAVAAGTTVLAAPVTEKKIPDFGGAWMSTHARKFIPFATGPGPVMDDPAHPHMARGVTADGRDFGTTAWVGDWRNPNLMPWVANGAKEAGRRRHGGTRHPNRGIYLLADGRSQHHEFF